MHTLSKSLIALSILTAPLFAGALTVEIGIPAANPEAQSKHAAVVARITACHSREKTTLTATAEGLINGKRQSIPLKMIGLSTVDTFAVAREWPGQGNWVIKIVATNPDYKNYVTGVLVPFERNHFDWAGIKHFYRAPTDAEIMTMLKPAPDSARTSLN